LSHRRAANLDRSGALARRRDPALRAVDARLRRRMDARSRRPPPASRVLQPHRTRVLSHGLRGSEVATDSTESTDLTGPATDYTDSTDRNLIRDFRVLRGLR